MAKQPREVYQARAAFVTAVDGKRRMVRAGELVGEGDPVLEGRGEMFEPVSEVVERATAAPGERRSVPTHPRVQEPEADEDEDEGVAAHTCVDCGRGFASPAALGAHRRSHKPKEDKL